MLEIIATTKLLVLFDFLLRHYNTLEGLTFKILSSILTSKLHQDINFEIVSKWRGKKLCRVDFINP
jgi:hypothetical protein